MKQLLILLSISLFACNTTAEKTATESATPQFFIGSWALDLNYENNKVGWLEVRQENGYLDADLLWRWGSVTPAEFVFQNDGLIIITNSRNVIRSRNEAGDPTKTHRIINWVAVSKAGENEITGTAYFPGPDGIEIERVTFSGQRIPDLPEKPDLSLITYGEPVNLLNEKELTGWKLVGDYGVNGWSIKDGILVNDPVQKEGEAHINYGNLQTIEKYDDFNIKLEVLVPEGSNSGVYLKGIYEIQVADSYGKETDSHNMGALYSRITPIVSAEKPAGEWQKLDITLYKRHLTVLLNDIKIIDNQPVKGVTGGAMTSDEFSPGPIYLQGDHGKVAYRNIILTPIE